MLRTCAARSEQPACHHPDVASGLLLKHILKHSSYEGATDHLVAWSLTRKTGSSFGKWDFCNLHIHRRPRALLRSCPWENVALTHQPWELSVNTECFQRKILLQFLLPSLPSTTTTDSVQWFGGPGLLLSRRTTWKLSKSAPFTGNNSQNTHGPLLLEASEMSLHIGLLYLLSKKTKVGDHVALCAYTASLCCPELLMSWNQNCSVCV